MFLLRRTKTLPLPLSASTSKILAVQICLIEIHRTLIKEKDDAHISNSTPSRVTEFSLESYVLLETILRPIQRGLINTRRTGPFLIKGISGNAYTLENLINKILFEFTSIGWYHFDPERVNPQSVALSDVDEFYIKMILSYRGHFTYKRSLELNVRWVGYDEAYDTWEPWKNLRNTDKLHDYLSLINFPNKIPIEHR